MSLRCSQSFCISTISSGTWCFHLWNSQVSVDEDCSPVKKCFWAFALLAKSIHPHATCSLQHVEVLLSVEPSRLWIFHIAGSIPDFLLSWKGSDVANSVNDCCKRIHWSLRLDSLRWSFTTIKRLPIRVSVDTHRFLTYAWFLLLSMRELRFWNFNGLSFVHRSHANVTHLPHPWELDQQRLGCLPKTPDTGHLKDQCWAQLEMTEVNPEWKWVRLLRDDRR